ncbi:hypothetical protein L6164_022547 [Bauhinia variegata]|uniref:Uncharacterized protein n=1 Tax=Bauhinia variegata TaxID=167791 RepID=A0ACB9MFZ2_BAUVA|nr:hypothetical protein L6164_022547 [Bauhinia variegata]
MELSECLVPGLCFLLTLICFHKLIVKRNKMLPPGPPGLPIIGHLHLMKSPIHRSLQKLTEKYGKVMFLRFGTLKVLVISSPSAVEECFTKNDVVFANRPRTLAGKYLNYNYTTIGFAPYGDHWRALRRLTSQELFSLSRLATLASARVDEVRLLLKQLFDKSEGKWTQVELRQRFINLVFDVTLRMISGKRYYGTDVVSQEAQEFKSLMDDVFELLNPCVNDLFPVLQRIDFLGMEKKMRKVMKKLDNFVQNLLEEHRTKRSSSSTEVKDMTMIDVMLSLQESDPKFCTDETIKGVTMAVLAAGTETSATTMEWALANLLNHPEAMNKVKAEIDSHVGQERLLEESDIPKLTYLQNIILETLRLYPAGALGVPHVSSKDCTVSGYHVPKGTMLMVNLWALHRDPKNWVEPTRFMPERFEKNNGQGAGGEAYNMVPFGAGRRQCPGANLAQRIMAFTLGSLIQCFEWKKPNEDKQLNMDEGDGLTLPRLEPLVALIRPRQQITPLLANLSA